MCKIKIHLNFLGDETTLSACGFESPACRRDSGLSIP